MDVKAPCPDELKSPLRASQARKPTLTLRPPSYPTGMVRSGTSLRRNPCLESVSFGALCRHAPASCSVAWKSAQPFAIGPARRGVPMVDRPS
jgi:hypothetical protein